MNKAFVGGTNEKHDGKDSSQNYHSTSLFSVSEFLFFEFSKNIFNTVIADSWFVIGIGWGKDQGYLKVAGEGQTGADPWKNAAIGTWTTPGTYFIGCFLSDCHSGASYLIHSVRAFNIAEPGIAADLYGAPANGKISL